MEKGLRDCCRSMRIGKILIRRDQDTKLPKVLYLVAVYMYKVASQFHCHINIHTMRPCSLFIMAGVLC